MNDKIKINLLIADATYPLTIDREDEQMVREAARQVNLKMNTYRVHYPGLSSERVLGMVAYEFSLEILKLQDRNDTAPYAEKINELTEVLENHLRNEG